MSQHTLDSMLTTALEVGLEVSRWVYMNNYVTGDRTISRRAPDGSSMSLTRIMSPEYATRAGVSRQTGLNHLRRLAQAGLLQECPGGSTRQFRFRESDAREIGQKIIESLRAEGLPFDDDWRKQSADSREA